MYQDNIGNQAPRYTDEEKVRLVNEWIASGRTGHYADKIRVSTWNLHSWEKALPKIEAKVKQAEKQAVITPVAPQKSAMGRGNQRVLEEIRQQLIEAEEEKKPRNFGDLTQEEKNFVDDEIIKGTKNQEIAEFFNLNVIAVANRKSQLKQKGKLIPEPAKEIERIDTAVERLEEVRSQIAAIEIPKEYPLELIPIHTKSIPEATAEETFEVEGDYVIVTTKVKIPKSKLTAALLKTLL